MTEDLLKMRLHATDVNGLAQVSTLLHDETFDLDGIQFDEAAQVVTLPIRRQFHLGPERQIARGFVSRTYEKDWMRSVATIRRVHSWEALDDQRIGSYSFNSWRFEGGVIEVRCNEILVLEFRVDCLDVEVSDIGFAGKARIKRGWFGIETSTGRIHD